MKPRFFLFIICFFSFSSVFSQAGIYVKFDGISNGSGPGSHNGEFLVTSFETTDTTTFSNLSTGSGIGRPYFGTVKLQKLLVPKANPSFMKYLATTDILKSATITWYNSSNIAYYQIVLGNVGFQSISILSPSCAGTDCSNLFEEMHLFYTSIQWKDPVSGTSIGYDLIRKKVF